MCATPKLISKWNQFYCSTCLHTNEIMIASICSLQGIKNSDILLYSFLTTNWQHIFSQGYRCLTNHKIKLSLGLKKYCLKKYIEFTKCCIETSLWIFINSDILSIKINKYLKMKPVCSNCWEHWIWRRFVKNFLLN